MTGSLVLFKPLCKLGYIGAKAEISMENLSVCFRGPLWIPYTKCVV